MLPVTDVSQGSVADSPWCFCTQPAQHQVGAEIPRRAGKPHRRRKTLSIVKQPWDPPQNLWPLGAHERFMRPEGFGGTLLCGILQVAPWDHTSPLTVISGAGAKKEQELRPSHQAVCAPPQLCFDFLNCWPHLLGKRAGFCTAVLMFASPRGMAGCISSLPGITETITGQVQHLNAFSCSSTTKSSFAHPIWHSAWDEFSPQKMTRGVYVPTSQPAPPHRTCLPPTNVHHSGRGALFLQLWPERGNDGEAETPNSPLRTWVVSDDGVSPKPLFIQMVQASWEDYCEGGVWGSYKADFRKNTTTDNSVLWAAKLSNWNSKSCAVIASITCSPDKCVILSLRACSGCILRDIPECSYSSWVFLSSRAGSWRARFLIIFCPYF